MNGTIIEPCDALAEVTSDYQGHYKKGISIMPISTKSIVDGRVEFNHTIDYLIAKNGRHEKKGIVCSYCPFCGEYVNPTSPKGQSNE